MESLENHAGRIVVRAFPEDGMNVVEIEDNGLGFPKEDRDRLLEPYMTTREKGTGLGLAIVRKIVEEHGGTIALDDAPGAERGALVRIRLQANDVTKPAPTTNTEEHGED